MRTLVLEGIVRAKTQIAHNGGELNGNVAMFRRFDVIQPDGKKVEIPHVSGNSIRGRLRDVSAMLMLKLLGSEDAPLQVDENTFQLLFSGGTLTSGNIDGDIAKYRQMRENLVHLSLFGGAYGKAILAGKMKVNPFLPIAKETAHVIPDKWKNFELPSVYNYLQMEMYTRKENANDVLFEPYLLKEEGKKVETSQMIYHVETIAAGTPFYWKVVLEDVSPVEFDFFLAVLKSFKEIPVVGGKSSIGFGQVEFEDISWRDIQKNDSVLTDVSETTESLYVKMLSENKDKIQSFIKTL